MFVSMVDGGFFLPETDFEPSVWKHWMITDRNSPDVPVQYEHQGSEVELGLLAGSNSMWRPEEVKGIMWFQAVMVEITTGDRKWVETKINFSQFPAQQLKRLPIRVKNAIDWHMTWWPIIWACCCLVSLGNLSRLSPAPHLKAAGIGQVVQEMDGKDAWTLVNITLK